MERGTDGPAGDAAVSAPVTKPSNGPQDNAARVVDAWFSDLVLSVGPSLTTEAFNKITVAKDTLKSALAAALA